MSDTLPTAKQPDQASDAAHQYAAVRRFSERIAEPLSAEDCAIQSMPDASPIRWHLAHTTWFFETFLLKASAGYRVFDTSFESLFNSYYNSIGTPFPRARRGVISRPGLEQTLAYREHVDRAMADWLGSAQARSPHQEQVLKVGLNHEQQHQELMLTDIKHALSCNPLAPAYREDAGGDGKAAALSWITVDEALCWMGHEGGGFAFDNEQPRHRYFLASYQLANRCVTNGEYLAFVEDGGYQRPELWLSMGWDVVHSEQWQGPLYWSRSDDQWFQFTLAGRKPLSLDEPVCHVSYFEADAYARWAGCRLPTEQEWEHAVCQQLGTPLANQKLPGHWSDTLLAARQAIHPQIRKGDAHGSPWIHAIGNLWQWTSSQHTAYPGFQIPDGALGEYNGKFMCNQFVLRGGSCASPSGHIRATYRNFFPPQARWQFAGIRLAK